MRIAAGSCLALVLISAAGVLLIVRDRAMSLPPAFRHVMPAVSIGTVDMLPVADYGTWSGDVPPMIPPQVAGIPPCLGKEDLMLAWYSLVPVTLDDDCRVAEGRWADAFTGRRTESPNQVLIIPVIPHRMAMAALDAADGNRSLFVDAWFSPSPNNLWIYMPVLTSGKDDPRDGAAIQAWQPRRDDLACLYARRWLAAKSSHGLAITGHETDAIARELGRCQKVSE